MHVQLKTALTMLRQQGLDNVRTKAGWLSRDKDDVVGWLKAEKYVQ